MGRNLNPDGKARLDASLILTYGIDHEHVACSWCRTIVNVRYGNHERDRIQPGGPYRPDNVMVTCPGCNGDRGSSTTGQWHERHRAYPAKVPVPAPRDYWRTLLADRRERAGRERAEREHKRARVRAEH